MKTRLVYSDYNKDTGISTVIINSKYGQFTGVSELNPEDKNYESSFLGCSIAEKRAIIKALRAQLREVKAMQKAIKIVINDLEKSKFYQKNSVENRRLRKTFWLYQKEIDKINNQITMLKMSIIKDPENRIKILKNLKHFSN